MRSRPSIDHARSVPLAHALDHRDVVAGSRRLPELELDHRPALRQLDLLDLLERLDAALHLSGLGGVGGEPIDEALFLGEHRLLARVGGLAVGRAQRPLALVEVVVARVDRDLAVVDVGDLAHDAVHEVAIVRRHEQRARQRFQEALEPDDGLDVEVVGGLVHEQHVGPAEQHARHGDAHLPAARERAHVAVDPLVVEAEAVQHLARLAFERVAAEVLVLLLHLAEAREDAVHLAGARRIGHRVLQGLELVVQVADPAAAGDHLVDDGSAGHLLDVLAEVADRRPLRHGHLAVVGGLLADDHAEERRLAAAVGPDQADLVAGVELERRVDEQHLLAVLLGDVVERDHKSAIVAEGRRVRMRHPRCR